MKNPIVTIKFKEYGNIKLELFRDVKNTTNNFLELASNGFYNGIVMHRMINDFMIQGGCPDGTGMGGAGYNIVGEFSHNNIENNHMHTKGTISMARAMDRNSASSQFFICTANTPHLDGQYAAFGEMIEGEDILDKLNELGTQSGKPKADVVIENIEIELFGEELQAVEKV